MPFLTTRKDIIDAISKHYLGGKPFSSEKVKILRCRQILCHHQSYPGSPAKEGYDVVVAHDGIEGLKMTLSERPSLIICDSVMPRMDGYGLKNAVHGNPATASIPIILLTSKASGEEEQKALQFGFIDFIPKPVQPLRVTSRVKRALAIAGKQ